MLEENKSEIREKINKAVMPKEYFTFSNGMIIKSVVELSDVLERAGNECFFSHVTDHKNDFAKWIYDTYGLADLSTLLGPVKSKDEMVRIIRAYIAAYIEPLKEREIIGKSFDAKNLQKFEDVSKLRSPLSYSQGMSEGKVSQKIVDLISKLEEKVDLKAKQGQVPLPPKELPLINPSENRNEPIEKESVIQAMQTEKKFVLPVVNKPAFSVAEEKKPAESNAKEIEEKLKKEIEEMEASMPVQKKTEEKSIETIRQEIKQEEKRFELPKVNAKPIELPKQEPKAEVIIKEEIKPEAKKIEEIKPEVKLTPVNLVVKEGEFDKINDPDKYFEKNPVLISQAIDAKKKTLQIDKLNMVVYSGQEQTKELMDIFKDNYAKSYQKMVELRKAGFDTSIAEIMIMRIPAKIKIYEASQEERDTIPVKRYLNEAIEELNNLK